ncbi:MAG: hypothetical protein KAR21_10330 [Spirochaetales bacterium]|nr:hypothetical protein [Spirochaetales bacterium]
MIKKQFILIILSISLISCIEVDSLIDIKEDGTGEWNFQYRISQEASFITTGLEFSGFNYFPNNEDELRKRTSEIPGLELLQVSVNETAEFIEYSARMSFLNTDNIESFFTNYAENSLIDISSDETGIFQLIIDNPYSSEIDQDTLKLLSALYSNKMINIVVAISGIVTNSSTGILSEDPGKAAFEIKTMDVLTMVEPVSWIINYE